MYSHRRFVQWILLKQHLKAFSEVEEEQLVLDVITQHDSNSTKPWRRGDCNGLLLPGKLKLISKALLKLIQFPVIREFIVKSI